MMPSKDKPTLVKAKPKGKQRAEGKKIQHHMRGPTATG
jgi:hypothetical protein